MPHHHLLCFFNTTSKLNISINNTQQCNYYITAHIYKACHWSLKLAIQCVNIRTAEKLPITTKNLRNLHLLQCLKLQLKFFDNYTAKHFSTRLTSFDYHYKQIIIYHQSLCQLISREWFTVQPQTHAVNTFCSFNKNWWNSSTDILVLQNKHKRKQNNTKY